ncbi:16S rRNA (cytosine(967)-C(5))-methyltransferase RsmB [Thermoanaerobacter pentosaceus]|uniref:16S rRNA (cytosine(967)-C(5))-methyltransferase n=1 Tax=Thermoanaerobacter pentosaceus TaxID=694059 RepID=A0ABT9M1M6_9THEO|nr:16S rRNA (cytosine(967)-C(5))-methyltransferase RsmB [Thermoanaerobacter pentosaceus]MDP9750026.1 16S rRNA (cytosine967-C5)-methyltransferase [Thermoanaerobacter pentosaceus]
MKPRKIAYKILQEVLSKEAYANISFNKHLKGRELKEVDRDFIKELAFGVIERKYTLDFILSFFVKKPADEKSKIFLEMGLYQLLYMDKVPSYAAINETVNIAKNVLGIKRANFINAVLRSYEREKEKVIFPDKERDLRKYLMVTYSYPDWIVERLLNNYDEEKAEALLKSLNEKPKICYRVNTLKIDIEDLKRLLVSHGIAYKKGYYLEEALYIDIKNPESHQLYKEGLIYIQDEASMLVSKILNPKEGETVLDVCAAPGGKTTHIAQLMKNTGNVVAFDLHPHRLGLIKENCKRLGITNVKAEAFDSTFVNDKYLEKADKVLADVPCTGIGIIRKKPDIKLKNYTKSEISQLVETQYKILDSSSKYVKKDGFLVYSTCTIGVEENHNVIMKFLKEHPNFRLVDIKAEMPSGLNIETASLGYVQTTPLEHGIDGFFISKLKRIK